MTGNSFIEAARSSVNSRCNRFVSPDELALGAVVRLLAIAVLCCSLACGDDTSSRDADAGIQRDARSELDSATEPDGGSEDALPSGCLADLECDDSVSCTIDRCSEGRCAHEPDHMRCGRSEVCSIIDGCTASRACATFTDCVDDDACTVNERCDDASRLCRWDTLDGDNDGAAPLVCGGGDCDDSYSGVNPGAPERCDAIDNDCDGMVDEDVPSDACGPNEVCEVGGCVCGVGITDCGRPATGRMCVDTANDPENCGGCGFNCAFAGAVCESGRCFCAPGSVECRSIIYDTLARRIGDSCVFGGSCHGGPEPRAASANLNFELARMDYRAVLVGVAATQAPNLYRIMPGSPDASYLWHKLTGTHLGPPVCGSGGREPALTSEPLDPAGLRVYRLWIEEGAPGPGGVDTPTPAPAPGYPDGCPPPGM